MGQLGYFSNLLNRGYVLSMNNTINLYAEENVVTTYSVYRLAASVYFNFIQIAGFLQDVNCSCDLWWLNGGLVITDRRITGSGSRTYTR